jgi:Uri superfamily endonuclease
VLKNPATIRIGKQEPRLFSRGHYVYVGSARKNMAQRLARHLRSEKKQFWHIDYLIPYMHVEAVWTSALSEQDIAASFSRDLNIPVKKFGASDTKSASHLFFSNKKPDFSHYPLTLLTDIKKRL